MARAGVNEIEIKLRIADLAALRRKLRALHARFLHRVHESNTLFDTSQQRLRKRGQLLRLRVETRPSSSARPPRSPRRALLTCKHSAGLHAPQRHKIRKEVELGISDPAALAQIFVGLGFRPAFRYEKFRSTYRLPKIQSVLVEVDETPIGIFVELEGSARAIDGASRLLGFTPKDYLLSSYAALYFDFCRRNHIPASDMLFSTVKSVKKLR
jgi:adenylate cyclase class 2